MLELRDRHVVCQCFWFVLRRAYCRCLFLAGLLLRRAGVRLLG